MTCPTKTPTTGSTVAGATTSKQKPILALYQRALLAINCSNVVVLGDLLTFASVLLAMLLIGATL